MDTNITNTANIDSKESVITKITQKFAKKLKSNDLYYSDGDSIAENDINNLNIPFYKEDDCFEYLDTTDNEEYCLDGFMEDFDIKFKSSKKASEREKAIEEVAFETLSITLKEDGFDIDSLGDVKICRNTLVEDTTKDHGRGDMYYILFCNEENKIVHTIDFESGGIDSDDIEHVEAMTSTHNNNVIITKEGTFMRNGKIKKSVYFTKSFDKAKEAAVNTYGEGVVISQERKMVFLHPENSKSINNVMYEFELNKNDGSTEKIYVHSMYDFILTKSELDEMNALLDKQNALLGDPKNIGKFHTLEEINEFLDNETDIPNSAKEKELGRAIEAYFSIEE